MDENDPKAENLMLTLYKGKESARCDGDIYGYSNMIHLLSSKVKKDQGAKLDFMKIVTNYFKPNFKVDYAFQYRYRSKDISFYYQKEFLCAAAMLGLFQYINYQYLQNFNAATILDQGDDEEV